MSVRSRTHRDVAIIGRVMGERRTFVAAAIAIGGFLGVVIALLVCIAILNTLAGGKTPLW